MPTPLQHSDVTSLPLPNQPWHLETYLMLPLTPLVAVYPHNHGKRETTL